MLSWELFLERNQFIVFIEFNVFAQINLRLLNVKWHSQKLNDSVKKSKAESIAYSFDSSDIININKDVNIARHIRNNE